MFTKALVLVGSVLFAAHLLASSVLPTVERVLDGVVL